MSFPVIKWWGFAVTFPDLVTALNLVAGVAAILAAVRGEHFTAVILVVAGMLFDFFDGRIARAYKLSHAFGRELDSLADLASFGLAPGVILLTLRPSDAVLVGASFFAVAAAFRLARFNLSRSKCFEGLPVPAAAFLLLVIAYPFNLPVWSILLLQLLLALLMLSRIKLPKP